MNVLPRFGKKVVDQFWSLKLISKPSDIFTINYGAITGIQATITEINKTLSESEFGVSGGSGFILGDTINFSYGELTAVLTVTSIYVTIQDNNINISIKGFNAQEILQHLDAEDIYVSSGSACGNKIKNPSETLKAIGLSKKEINSSLRISLGKSNTTTDIEKFLIVFKKILKKIKDSRFTNLSHHHHQIPHH